MLAMARGEELLAFPDDDRGSPMPVALGIETKDVRGETELEEHWGLTMISKPFIAATATCTSTYKVPSNSGDAGS